jgi:ABC-type transport system involved in cytochrome c biogenesis permease subunit
MIGFITLLIAHHLSMDGDTMEMMRAVLDTNGWLATHVVCVTLGYASTFLAGFLALTYIVRGAFTRSLDRDTARSLARMVYGIVCFATLFSFVGTILGGIWADQSWGRFWGWDPKENGALLIVLWNAIILHARWGGLVRQRGLMVLAVFGNVVTSWSWFGVNMLGIGLHSYGFMDSAFPWLIAFGASQLVFIMIGLLPPHLWRSRFEPERPKQSRALVDVTA